MKKLYKLIWKSIGEDIYITYISSENLTTYSINFLIRNEFIELNIDKISDYIGGSNYFDIISMVKSTDPDIALLCEHIPAPVMYFNDIWVLRDKTKDFLKSFIDKSLLTLITKRRIIDSYLTGYSKSDISKYKTELRNILIENIIYNI